MRSHTRIFTRSSRRPRKTKRCPSNGLSLHSLRTIATRPSWPRRSRRARRRGTRERSTAASASAAKRRDERGHVCDVGADIDAQLGARDRDRYARRDRARDDVHGHEPHARVGSRVATQMPLPPLQRARFDPTFRAKSISVWPERSNVAMIFAHCPRLLRARMRDTFRQISPRRKPPSGSLTRTVTCPRVSQRTRGAVRRSPARYSFTCSLQSMVTTRPSV